MDKLQTNLSLDFYICIKLYKVTDKGTALQTFIDRIFENPGRHKYLHIIYWSGVVLFFGFFWGSSSGEYAKYYVSEIILLPVKMAAVYLITYWLIPEFLFKRKYYLFMFLSLLIMTCGGILLRIICIHIIYILYPPADNYEYLNIYEIMHRIVDINTLLIIPALGKILITWFANKQRAENLEKENIKAELNYLKARVHPHFLFNTLNNLYSLIKLQDNKAETVVLKLSELMRYMLNDANKDYIPLTKEIQFLNNYIELEKIRFDEKYDISFSVYGETEGKTIAPMIFLSFFENAFKHGLSNELKCGWITFEIKITGNHLILNIENSIIEGYVPAVKNGFGLINVRKRLDLIYGKNYNLEINSFNDYFSVKLDIKL